MDTNSHILPHILATLSRKPDTGDNIDNLCDEVEYNVATEYRDVSTNDIRKDITKALEVAQNLGIISITNEKIRLPLYFAGNQKRAPGIVWDAVDESIDDRFNDAVVDTAIKSSRRKRSSPRKRAQLTEDDSQCLRMIPRKNAAMERRRSARTRRPRRGRTTARGRVSRRRISRRRR